MRDARPIARQPCIRQRLAAGAALSAALGLAAMLALTAAQGLAGAHGPASAPGLAAAQGLAGGPAQAVAQGLAGGPAQAGAQGPAGGPDAAILEIVGRVDGDRALTDLRRLSGETEICAGGECGQIANRLTGSAALALALEYVRQAVDSPAYEATFVPWARDRYADRNLILRKTGVISPAEEVYVVAHVDGVSSCPGPQCPAADDNGSGTVAAMEVARTFADTDFARTVVVFFSTGEEQGSLGVSAYIDSSEPARLAAIHSLINVDMLGFDSDGDNAMELYYGDHAPSLALAHTISRTIGTYEPILVPRIDPGCG
jgi:hypothetical protein